MSNTARALVALLALVPSALARGAELEVVRYDLALRVEPQTKLVRGEATITISARDGALERASFSLNDLLAVSSVQRDGRDAKFQRGERIAEGRAIEIVLDPPLAAKQTCKLSLVYEGQGLDPDEQGSDWMGILLVRSDEVRMSHQAQWYPIVPRDDRAISKLAAPTQVELDLPPGFESLGPGTLQSVKKQKGREIHLWKSERPVQPSILAGEFAAQTVKRDKTSIRVLSFADHKSGAKKWAEDAAESLETLNGLLGKLDVASYGLGEMRVKNGSKSYNYEADGFSVYDGVLFDGRAPDAKKIAHEVAHLWFGGAVDASGPGERFLTEGLAEHAAWMAVEARSGETAGVESARKGLDRYFNSPGDEAPLATADFRSPRYSQVVYAKGAFVLRTLCAWIGREAFLAGVREYVAKAKERGGTATLDDFLAAMRAKGGAGVDAWSEDWLRRKGTPSYTVELDSESGGGSGGKLIQTGELYRNPIELELRGSDGKARILVVTPTELSHAWTSDAPGKIASVAIDPRALVLFARQR